MHPLEFKVKFIFVFVQFLIIVSQVNNKTRSELFHIRVVSKHTKIDTLFDLDSHANLILESVVKKIGLETKPHPKPYYLGCL